MDALESRPTLSPGVCFICEQSNDEPYIDTLRNFDPPSLTNLTGRKYLCKSCVVDSARVFGFASPEKVAAIAAERDAALEVAREAELRADLADTIREAANVLAAGYPGLAASKEPVVEQSVPKTDQVKDAEIISTTTPEAGVVEAPAEEEKPKRKAK